MANQDERDFSMDEAPCHYSGEESFAWTNGASHGYTLGFRAAMAAMANKPAIPVKTQRKISALQKQVKDLKGSRDHHIAEATRYRKEAQVWIKTPPWELSTAQGLQELTSRLTELAELFDQSAYEAQVNAWYTQAEAFKKCAEDVRRVLAIAKGTQNG